MSDDVGKGSAAMRCSLCLVPKSLLARMWRCLVVRRKQWRRAKAANTLLAYAFDSGDSELAKFMEPLHDRLWAKVYGDDNGR